MLLPRNDRINLGCSCLEAVVPCRMHRGMFSVRYLLYTITILMIIVGLKEKPTMSSLSDSRRRQKRGDFYIRPFTTKTFQARMGMQERGRGCTYVDTLRTPVRCRTFNHRTSRGHASILSNQCGHTSFAGTATQSLRRDENGTGSPCVGWFDHRCCHR